MKFPSVFQYGRGDMAFWRCLPHCRYWREQRSRRSVEDCLRKRSCNKDR